MIGMSRPSTPTSKGGRRQVKQKMALRLTQAIMPSFGKASPRTKRTDAENGGVDELYSGSSSPRTPVRVARSEEDEESLGEESVCEQLPGAVWGVPPTMGSVDFLMQKPLDDGEILCAQRDCRSH